MENNLMILTELYNHTNGVFKEEQYLDVVMNKNSFFNSKDEALATLTELHKNDHLYIDRTRLFGDTYSFRKPTWTKIMTKIEFNDVVFDETPTKLKKVAPVRKDGAFKRHKDILMFIDKLGQVVFKQQVYEFMDKINMDSNILEELVEADLLKRSESIARTGEYIYILKKGAVTRLRNKNGSKDISSVRITSHREMLSFYRMGYILMRIKSTGEKKQAMDIVKKIETIYHSNLFTNKNNVSVYVERLMKFYISNDLPLGYSESPNVFALEIQDEKKKEDERANGLNIRAEILQLKKEIKELECEIKKFNEEDEPEQLLAELKQTLADKEKSYEALGKMEPKERRAKKYKTENEIINNSNISTLVSRNAFITNLRIDTTNGKYSTHTDIAISYFLIGDKESISNIVRDIVLTYKIADKIKVSLFSGFNTTASVGASGGKLHFSVYSTYPNMDKLIKEIKATEVRGTSLWNLIKLISVE